MEIEDEVVDKKTDFQSYRKDDKNTQFFLQCNLFSLFDTSNQI